MATCIIIAVLIASVLSIGVAYHAMGDTSGKSTAITLVQHSTMFTYRFDMDRGYARKEEDRDNIHVQRVPQRGGMPGINPADIIDVSIVCSHIDQDGEVSIIRHPWVKDPPPKKGNEWAAWYTLRADKDTKNVFLVISSYSVTDTSYGDPLPCSIVFTLA
jgi:hypothetical protein